MPLLPSTWLDSCHLLVFLLAIVCRASPPPAVTGIAGIVISCSSRIAFVISCTTYLDCVGSTGSSEASSLSLITTTNDEGATVTEIAYLFNGTTTLVTLVSPSENLLPAPPQTASPGRTTTMKTVNGQGSTIFEVIGVQRSSTSIVSTISPPTASLGLSTTTQTVNGQISTMFEFIIVPGSSRVVVSAILPSTATNTEPTAGTIDTIATTNSLGSNVSETDLVAGLSTNVVSSLPPQSQSTQAIITKGVTSTITTTHVQGELITQVVVISPSTTEIIAPSPASATQCSATPTSTEIVLPPGTSIEILSSGAYASDQWLTNTKPGSSSETVIHIVVPPGLRPIALWDVVPGPPPGGDDPPNIVINEPGLL